MSNIIDPKAAAKKLRNDVTRFLDSYDTTWNDKVTVLTQLMADMASCNAVLAASMLNLRQEQMRVTEKETKR